MGHNPRDLGRQLLRPDIPNPFIAGGSIQPTISGFNPTLTMQVLAYMTATPAQDLVAALRSEEIEALRDDRVQAGRV